ncbi:MAG TPA: hypothetical protein VF503_19230 [Sphingobium sp.]|uniref:hypothetical protein n=1 Tax=Sphingobium sp. TaxID=1912891 RepID=UPI002ECFFC3C
MDLDTLCTRYFGTTELETLDEASLEAGKEQLAIDFAVEQEPSRRFALWALMAGLDIAPSPADAFPKDEKLRAAANAYLDIQWKLTRDE